HSQSDFISSVLPILQYLLQNIRAIFMVIIFYKTSSSWHDLSRELGFLINIFLLEKSNRRLYYLRIISIVFFIFTFLLWIATDFTSTSGQFSMFGFSWTSEDVFAPFPLKFTFWQLQIMYELFNSFPFFISQQIYLALTICSVLLCDVVIK